MKTNNQDTSKMFKGTKKREEKGGRGRKSEELLEYRGAGGGQAIDQLLIKHPAHTLSL